MYRPLFEQMRSTGSCTDTEILRLSVLLHRDRLDDRNRYTQERVNMWKEIHRCQENGLVAVVEGGMDCDCCQYEGHVHLFPIDPVGFNAAMADMYHNAEGSIHWNICKPSEARNIKSTSRDLALEAFENGHAWQVYS